MISSKVPKNKTLVDKTRVEDGRLNETNPLGTPLWVVVGRRVHSHRATDNVVATLTSGPDRRGSGEEAEGQGRSRWRPVTRTVDVLEGERSSLKRASCSLHGGSVKETTGVLLKRGK